jgi:hypothetical protein
MAGLAGPGSITFSGSRPTPGASNMSKPILVGLDTEREDVAPQAARGPGGITGRGLVSKEI